MMLPYRRVLSPTPVDLLERLVTEKEQQNVGLEKEGNGWRAWGQVDGGSKRNTGSLGLHGGRDPVSKNLIN